MCGVVPSAYAEKDNGKHKFSLDDDLIVSGKKKSILFVNLTDLGSLCFHYIFT